MSLTDELACWTEWGVAAFRLGRVLGLFAGQDFSTDARAVFWTDNPLGTGLHDALIALVSVQVLETERNRMSSFSGGRDLHDQLALISRIVSLDTVHRPREMSAFPALVCVA